MNEQQNIEERLWEFIDGQVQGEEKSIIEKLLQSSLEWKEKYRELLDLHHSIQSTTLDEPSMRFTKNVMEGIAKYYIAPATKTYINKKIVWGIAAFFIVLITGFLIYGFGQVNWSDTGGSSMSLGLDKIDFSKFFNNTWINIFVMVNLVLGLFFLDRFLASKKKKIQNEA
jgi:hypothetical protein